MNQTDSLMLNTTLEANQYNLGGLVPPFYIRGFMAVYDLRQPVKGISTGQKIVSMGANNIDLEKRVSGLEDKLDTILTLLNNKEKLK